jgi:hypothetical protein
MRAVTEVHLSSVSCDGASESTVELRTLCSALSRAVLFNSITSAPISSQFPVSKPPEIQN